MASTRSALTSASRGPVPARLRRARLAVLAYFAVLGLANGDWLARIPAIKHGLHLSDGLLGVALLAAPAGLVAVVPLAGPLIDRIGSRVPTVAAAFAVALMPIAIGLAAGQAALMAGLFAFGVVSGLMDVSMNSQAVHVERRFGRPLMTSFHACYSFGALAGGLIGGAFAWANVGPAANFIAVGLPLAALTLIAARGLVPDGHAGPVADERPVAPVAPAADDGVPGSRRAGQDHADQRDHRDRRGRRNQGDQRDKRGRLSPLLVLSLLALCSLLGEGAADSWSAVYLHDNLATSAGFAALAFSAFALTMAFGRLAGDRLALRFGSAALVRGGGILAALGMGGVLLSPSPVGAIAGFAVYGAGLSCTFPQLLSAAGKLRPDRPAGAIARVAGLGYVGLLGGPVLIGGIASVAGLTVALGLPAVLALCMALGAGFGARH